MAAPDDHATDDRELHPAKWVLLTIFSPTRTLIDYLKVMPGQRDKRWRLLCWSWLFLAISFLTAMFLFLVRPCDIAAKPWHFAFFVIPYSRINEILWAFLRDVPSQLRHPKEKSGLTPTDRLFQAARSYIEVTINFGIVYFMLPADCFRFANDSIKCFATIGEAVYFSGATITTTGYGDITPRHGFSQFVCLYELAVGLVLIVGAVASYISIGAGESNPPQSEKTDTTVP